MSRRLSLVALPIAAMLSLTAAQSRAQDAPLTAEQAIENSRRMVAPTDESACPAVSDADEIVVCADRKGDWDRFVGPERGPTPGRRERGRPIDQVDAAPCTMCTPKLGGGVGMGFGYVPPPVIPFAEVMKGLPEPDMVVPEGTSEAEARGTTPVP